MANETNLKADDRGISPVIGVVLLVGITVVLSAVVGTLVLSSTGAVSEKLSGPGEANVTATVTADNVTVTHNGGDELPADSVVIKGDVANDPVTWDEHGTVSEGDSLTLNTTKEDATVYVLVRDQYGEETLLAKAEN